MLPIGNKNRRDVQSPYENLPFPFQSLDIEGKIVEVNHHWLTMLGYSRNEVIGTSFSDYIHPDTSSFFKDQFAVLIQVGSIANVELHLQNSQGDIVYVALDGVIWENPPEDIQQTRCILRDITENTQLKNKRRAAEALWTRTFDAIADIVTIQDKHLRIIKANKAAHSFFQAKAGELIGRYCYDVFTGKAEPCPQCPILSTLQDGNSHTEIITHEKLEKVFRVSSSCVPANDTGEEYLVHVATDITESIRSDKILHESEERFAKAFHANPAPMVISEIDSGLFVDVNQRWVEMLGYSREELIGKTSKEVGIWVDPSRRDSLVAELSTKSFFKECPITFKTKSSETRFALWSAEVITIDDRDLMLSLINDITERDEALQALKKSEEKFALAFDASPDSININRLEDGLYIDVNRGFIELTGYTREDVAGRTSREINIWHNPLDRKRLVDALKTTGYCENLEAKFRKKDGNLTTALMSARIIVLDNVPHILSITRDISNIKKAEQKIAEQKLLFESMFNAIQDGVVITDIHRNIILANSGMTTTFGYDVEDLIGRTTRILYSDVEAFTTAGKNVFTAISDQPDQRYTTSYRHKSGRIFPGETFGVKLYDHNRRWIGNLGIIRDISEQQEIQAERERLVAAIEQTSDAIVITDPTGNIQYVNPAFEKVSGYSSSEVIGQNPRILKTGEQDASFYRTLWETITTGRTFKGRMVNKRKSGDLFTEEATISPVCDERGNTMNYIAVKRDISQQLLLEAQFYQAQKMEAVGRLTGGVAHDFNNILGVIIGYTEMALEQTDTPTSLHANLRKVLEAAEKSANLIRQLLAFSRQQTITPKVLNLNSSIEELLMMLQRLIGEDIELHWHPGQNLQLIKIDPTQIDQILVNLCVNAKDAIIRGGKITLETHVIIFDDAYCADHIGFHPGQFVQLSVSDNGSGIDKEAQKKIFEPFFSTKELGRGTGLGLSTVYGIIKQNNGFINVYSELNIGTTFKLYFPVCHEELQSQTKQPVAGLSKGHGQTILIVEDDAAILAMIEKTLEKLGYRLLTAHSPGEALDILEQYSHRIDLLLTDVVMPEMNGRELAKLFQTRQPRIKVLFMSGYTANVIVHNGILDKGINFIQKPFFVSDLTAKIQDVMARD